MDHYLIFEFLYTRCDWRLNGIHMKSFSTNCGGKEDSVTPFTRLALTSRVWLLVEPEKLRN